MTDEPMLKRLSLALYNKAASLGLCVDPEGCGDLTPSTVLVMAVLEEMIEALPEHIIMQAGAALAEAYDHEDLEAQAEIAFYEIVGACKEGK